MDLMGFQWNGNAHFTSPSHGIGNGKENGNDHGLSESEKEIECS